MIRSYQKNIGLFIILAVALTGIGYAIDSDPAYPKLSTSLMEFAILTTITFIALSLCYVGYHFIGETLFNSK
ncbi:MAG: nitrate reductase NapE component [Dokdonia sp.]|jgi:nitrate reductase NapE component